MPKNQFFTEHELKFEIDNINISFIEICKIVQEHALLLTENIKVSEDIYFDTSHQILASNDASYRVRKEEKKVNINFKSPHESCENVFIRREFHSKLKTEECDKLELIFNKDCLANEYLLSYLHSIGIRVNEISTFMPKLKLKLQRKLINVADKEKDFCGKDNLIGMLSFDKIDVFEINNSYIGTFFELEFELFNSSITEKTLAFQQYLGKLLSQQYSKSKCNKYKKSLYLRDKNMFNK